MQPKNKVYDIFKMFKVLEVPDKTGDILAIQDRQIGKRVLRIQGSVSANNFVRIPGSKSSNKTMDLDQDYLYLQAKLSVGSTVGFLLDLEYTSHPTLMTMRNVKFHFSTLFKKMVLNKQKSLLQIPLIIRDDRWGTYVIDLKSYVALLCDGFDNGNNQKENQANQSQFIKNAKNVNDAHHDSLQFKLKGIQLNATMLVKNVYCSGQLFTQDSFPQEMQMLLRQGQTYDEVYYYTVMFQEPIKENILPVGTGKIHPTSPKKKIIPSPSKISQGKKDENIEYQQKLNQVAEQYNNNDDEMINQHQMQTYNLDNNNQLISSMQQLQYTTAKFELQPQPIMRLTAIDGFSAQPNNLFVMPQKTLNTSLLLSCLRDCSTIIIQQACGGSGANFNKTSSQRYLFNNLHKIEKMSCTPNLNGKGGVLVATDEHMIKVWRVFNQSDNQSVEQIGEYKTSFQSVATVHIAMKPKKIYPKKEKANHKNNRQIQDQGYNILLVGNEMKKNTKLGIYQMIEVLSETEIICRGRAKSDIRAGKIIFVSTPIPLQIQTQTQTQEAQQNDKQKQELIVTCGKENVTFYKLNKETRVLSNHIVFMGAHARDTTFLCCAYCDNQLFVGSSRGTVHLIDAVNKQHVSVYQVCDTIHKVNAIEILENIDVIAQWMCIAYAETIRIFSPDFSQTLHQISLQSQALSIAPLLSGGQLIVGLQNGQMLRLHPEQTMSEHTLKTVVLWKAELIARNCSFAECLMTDYHLLTGQLVAIFNDFSIKVFKEATDNKGAQCIECAKLVYEWHCFEQQATFIRCYPSTSKHPYFAVGYQNGMIRVFDVSSYSVVFESDYFKHSIKYLGISMNNPSINELLLLALDDESNVAMYDANCLEITKILNSSDDKIERNKTIQAEFLHPSLNMFYILKSDNLGTPSMHFYGLASFNLVYVYLFKQIEPNNRIRQLVLSPNSVDMFVSLSQGEFAKYRITYQEADQGNANVKQAINVALQVSYPNFINLHQFVLSPSCQFIIGIFKSETSNDEIKVMDYLMRRCDSSWQTFSCLEPLSRIGLTANPYVVYAFGRHSFAMYQFQFAHNLQENNPERSLEGISLSAQTNSQVGVLSIAQQNEAEYYMQQSSFAEVKQKMPDLNALFKPQNYEECGGGGEKQEDLKKAINISLKTRADVGPIDINFAQTQDSVKNQFLQLQNKIQQNEQRIDQQSQSHFHNPMQFDNSFSERKVKQPHQLDMDNLNLENALCPVKDKLQLHRIFGFNTQQQNSTHFQQAIWNDKQEYIAQLCNSHLIIQYMEEEKPQHIISFNKPFAYVGLARGGRVLYLVDEEASVVMLYDAIQFFHIITIQIQQQIYTNTIQKGRNINSNSSMKKRLLLTCQQYNQNQNPNCIQDYLCLIYLDDNGGFFENEHKLKQNSNSQVMQVNIIDVTVNKCFIVSRSTLRMGNSEEFIDARWAVDHATPSTNPHLNILEFVVATTHNITFFRFSAQSQSLEYQTFHDNTQLQQSAQQLQSSQQQYISNAVSKYGLYQSMDLLSSASGQEVQDQTNNGSSLVLVGTHQGDLIIFDLRGGNLVCVIQKVTNAVIPLHSLRVLYNEYLIVSSYNQPSLFWWALHQNQGKESSMNILQSLVETLQTQPQSVLLDSFVTQITPKFHFQVYSSLISNDYLENNSVCLINTRNGQQWCVDLFSRTTLRMAFSHTSSIRQLQIHNSLLFSMSSERECLVKVWDMARSEVVSEIYIPLHEALCFDIIMIQGRQVVCLGLSDATVRFFDLNNGVFIGKAMLKNNNNQQAQQLEQQVNQQVTALKVIPDSCHILTASSQAIYMIQITRLEEFQIQIALLNETNHHIMQIELSPFFQQDVFLLNSFQGKVMVWQRKNLQNMSINKVVLSELQYYLIDNYKMTKFQALPGSTSKLAQNKNTSESKQSTVISKIVFSASNCNVYLAINSELEAIIVRDYKDHLIVRNIRIGERPCSLAQSMDGASLYLGTLHGRILTFDFDTGLELDRREITTTPISNLGIFACNSNEMLEDQQQEAIPMLLVSSTENEIIFWKIF